MAKAPDAKQDEHASKAQKDSTANGTSDKEVAQPAKLTVAAQLRANVALLERAVQAKDTRLIVGRLLRQTAAIRQQLQPSILKSLVEGLLNESCPTRSLLIQQLGQVSSLPGAVLQAPIYLHISLVHLSTCLECSRVL